MNSIKINKINYLRLSVTDRCNLRCMYCRPSGANGFVPAGEILRLEEMARAVDILARSGIEFVRITGGEPLVRKNVEALVRMLKEGGAVKEISLTTNGVLLKDRLSLLLHSGLDRVNISLNTFNRSRYYRLTGMDKLEEVLLSIKNAFSIPDFLVKINVVVLKGINDDEVEDFAAFTVKNRVCVRFIEYFPSGNGRSNLCFLPGSVVREKIEKRFGTLIPDEVRGSGPAVNYRIDSAEGNLGFINTRTSSICENCNRIRLTAAGGLYPCLFSRARIDLKKMLRNGSSEEEIGRRVNELMFRKRLYSKENADEYDVVMSEMGG